MADDIQTLEAASSIMELASAGDSDVASVATSKSASWIDDADNEAGIGALEPSNHVQKKRRKRRKPTQNCSECVERKTKCDRARPSCLSCRKRQVACFYTREADVIAASKHETHADANQSLRKSSDAQSSGSISNAIPSALAQGAYFAPPTNSPVNSGRMAPLQDQYDLQDVISRHAENSRGRVTSLGMFGIGSRHPFHNYWTSSGGVPEVIGVLPTKTQADHLVYNYFESVDPIYPLVSEQEFREEYNRFWSLSLEDQKLYDAAHLALQFVIYACAVRLVNAFTPEQRLNTSNFYLSASYQCLCIHSYLNCFAITTVKTAILMCHFLISENNVSDAWTFSGMTHRLACGLELHRDPDIVRPEATSREKQDRCKVWLCCMFQDASLSMFLALPPTILHYDIKPAYLEISNTRDDQPPHRRRSIYDEAPPQMDLDISSANDVPYLQALWGYVSFLQTHICVPKALDKPLCADQAHKELLIAEYRQIYDEWPAPFNSYDSARFEILDQRLLRQVIAVSSSYFLVSTGLYMDSNKEAGIECDVTGALDAAHQGIAAFFALQRLDPRQIDSWGAYHTRAFFQATMIGTILAAQPKHELAKPDVRLMLAKSDFDRYLDILVRGRGTEQYESIQANRIADLQTMRRNIVAV